MVKLSDIKKSLIEQLKLKGADIDCFMSLIDDFIFYTKMEREMQADIKKNGIRFKSVSSTGKPYEKENPCVKNVLQCNKQRLQILKELNLKTDETESLEDDEL